MSLLAVLLAAVGVADLLRPRLSRWQRSVPLLSAEAGLVVAVLVAVALGFGWHSLWIGVVVAFVVAAWTSRSRPLMGLLPVAAAAALLAGGLAPRHAPPVAGWYASLEIDGLAAVPVRDAVLAVAVSLFLVRSANVVVRLVLIDAGPGVLEEEHSLKGGRVLGPLERIVIFALAISGQVAAVGAVIAAKGILRFPELSRDDDSGRRAEYVLVGSFVSWSLALVFVPLF